MMTADELKRMGDLAELWPRERLAAVMDVGDAKTKELAELNVLLRSYITDLRSQQKTEQPPKRRTKQSSKYTPPGVFTAAVQQVPLSHGAVAMVTEKQEHHQAEGQARKDDVMGWFEQEHGKPLDLARKIAVELINASVERETSADAIREVFEVRYGTGVWGSWAGRIFQVKPFLWTGKMKQSSTESSNASDIRIWTIDSAS